MKGFNVLLTCCGMHISERINDLKNNEDCVPVKVYACNCNENNLPYGCAVEGCFVVPPISSPEYIPTLIDICKDNEIDIIIPTVTLELQFMAEHKEEFESNGIKVSISCLPSIKISNNKLLLYNLYSSIMPKTIATKSYKELLNFSKSLNGSQVCLKLADHCGGNGFAVIDDTKAYDMNFFNRRGDHRYLGWKEAENVFKRLNSPILAQEKIDGVDYSVSALAVNGEVSHLCGYFGYSMSYGAIEHGKITVNCKAYEIVKKICLELMIDGNVCFDFIIDKNGNVFLLEINPRVNASLPFVTKAGVNLLYLRCKNLLGDYSDVGQGYAVKEGLQMKKYHESRYFL